MVVLTPSLVHAGTFALLNEKIKAMFVPEKQDNEELLATSQTIALFKPVVVDSTTTRGTGQDQDVEKESLQAVSGPMRVSTEDVYIPTTDTISVYEVKKGDTLSEVAKLFGVSVNTIMWANDLKSRTLTKGDMLLILPVTGIKHTVRKGETISSVSKKYSADSKEVAAYNGLAVDADLEIDSTIIVPDGEIKVVQAPTLKKPKVASPVLSRYAKAAPQGFLVRPVSGGRRSQGIHGHNGIDIASTPGTPVVAAADGRILVARDGGYNGGYGNMIIISHANGIQTVYAHLLAVDVTSGQMVSQGQVIGSLGNTGKSTGPHLHFEVRGAKNPF